MDNNFRIYNTLTRKKEVFKPIHPGHVGMYVCGPTVKGPLAHSLAHLLRIALQLVKARRRRRWVDAVQIVSENSRNRDCFFSRI